MTEQYAVENEYYVIYSEEAKKTKAFLAVRGGKNQKAMHKMVRDIGKAHGQKLLPTFPNNGILIEINTLDESIVKAIVSDITLQFKEAGYSQSCMVNNTEANLSLYKMGDNWTVANDVAIMEYVNATNQANAQTINPVLGLIGAILGIAVGTAAWIIVGELGYFVGWISFIMVLLGVKGFQLLGKGITKGWGVVILVLSVLAIIFAQFFTLGLELYQVVKEEIALSLSIAEVIELMPEILAEPDVRSEFIRNLLMGLLIGGVGMISSLKGVPSKAERAETIQYSRVA